MAAIETITGFNTAPGAGAALTMSAGTQTIRDFKAGRAYLVDFFKNGQAAAGFARIVSPKLHDAVQGIRMQANFGACRPLIPWGFPQRMYAQDTLTITNAGSGVAGDIENVGATVWYESPSGSNARLIGLDDLENRMQGPGNLFTVTFALVGAVSGAWGAQQALSAGTGDLTKANTDYALLGVSFSESAANNAAAVGVVSSDTGNYRIAIPTYQNDHEYTEEYFIRLSKANKQPMIPVINSANKGGTLFDVLNNENANTVTASFIFAQLS